MALSNIQRITRFAEIFVARLLIRDRLQRVFTIYSSQSVAKILVVKLIDPRLSERRQRLMSLILAFN